jgi:hypothetical protein
VIDESDLQYEKHFDSRISTFLGIKIDWSDDPENASDSIRIKFEFDSKTIHLSASDSFPMPHRPRGWARFKKIIEVGIQTEGISVFFSEQCGPGLIEPLSTTIRRS